MPYKISGTLSDNCNVKVFKGNEYVGYLDVTGSTHEVIFDLTSSGTVTAVAEKSDGEVVGYGNVTPISTGDAVNILSVSSGGATIENIQEATITLSNASGSDTATITEVDPDNTVLLFNGFKGADDLAAGNIKVVLTDGTTVTANRVGSWVGECVVKVTVLEFTDGSIAGVQRGTINIAQPATSNTDSITSVDTSKSVLLKLGATTGGGTINDLRCHIELTNSTTVTATRDQSLGDVVVSYEVLEFN